MKLKVSGVGTHELWEGYLDSRICSRDTYPESYIPKFTSIRRLEVDRDTFSERECPRSVLRGHSLLALPG